MNKTNSPFRYTSKQNQHVPSNLFVNQYGDGSYPILNATNKNFNRKYHILRDYCIYLYLLNLFFKYFIKFLNMFFIDNKDIMDLKMI